MARTTHAHGDAHRLIVCRRFVVADIIRPVLTVAAATCVDAGYGLTLGVCAGKSAQIAADEHQLCVSHTICVRSHRVRVLR